MPDQQFTVIFRTHFMIIQEKYWITGVSEIFWDNFGIKGHSNSRWKSRAWGLRDLFMSHKYFAFKNYYFNISGSKTSCLMAWLDFEIFYLLFISFLKPYN